MASPARPSARTTVPGEKVAILDAFAAPTMNADVQEYSRRHGLPPAKFSQKVFHGCQVGCDIGDQQGWYGEETLDVEAVHTMAPGAHIKYIGAADPGPGLDNALAYAVDHRIAPIATNSYGFAGEDIPRGLIQLEQQIFKQAISEGIGLYFSSGDNGDEQATLGHTSADFPASSPDVTAVGGTTLGRRALQQLPVRGGLGHDDHRPGRQHLEPAAPRRLPLRLRRRHQQALR